MHERIETGFIVEPEDKTRMTQLFDDEERTRLYVREAGPSLVTLWKKIHYKPLHGEAHVHYWERMIRSPVHRKVFAERWA